MDRKTFIFYQSYMDMAQKIKDKKTRCDFYESIMNAALKGEPLNDTGDPLIDMAYIGIRPLIAANIKNYENGCRGGAPVGNTNAKKQPENNPNSTNKQPKTTQKQPYKDKDIDKDKNKDSYSDKDKDKDEYEDKENKDPASQTEPEEELSDDEWWEKFCRECDEEEAKAKGASE